MNHRIGGLLLCMWIAACGGDDGVVDPPDPPDPTIESILAGSFEPLAAFSASEARGRAQLVRFLDGTTEVSVHLNRLDPATDYSAHVHALPCEFGAGGHYKLDPSIATTSEANEIWPGFSTDDAGAATSTVTVAHLARGDAMSIVVHDPASGDKMLCADLLSDDSGDVATGGPVAPFASAGDSDQSIDGMTTVVRRGADTIVSIDVSGLDPAEQYVSHVHALPCDVQDAGGHYQLDPTLEPSDSSNEISPTLVVDSSGSASDSFEVTGHAVREDAQSIVVHRVTASGAPKVACADLLRGAYPPLLTQGSALLLEQASARGLGDLAGEATMTRTFTQQTAVELSADGLLPNTVYTAHVHNRPCDLDSGGGHYQIDTAIAETVEDNEIWLSLETDSTGAGDALARVEHLARPDAQSIVLHDPVDGARLACWDLD